MSGKGSKNRDTILKRFRQSTIEESLFGKSCSDSDETHSRLSISLTKNVMLKSETKEEMATSSKEKYYRPLILETEVESNSSNEEIMRMSQIIAHNGKRKPPLKKCSSIQGNEQKYDNRNKNATINVDKLKNIFDDKSINQSETQTHSTAVESVILEDFREVNPMISNCSMGSDISSLLRTSCISSCTPHPSPAHTVLVSTGKHPPVAYPSTTRDPTYSWTTTESYSTVRMPCSCKNRYPLEDDADRLVSRWKLVEEALVGAENWKDVWDLQNAILSYNHRRRSSWSFDNLHRFFRIFDVDKRYFAKVVPEMARLVLRLPEIITQPLPILRQNCPHSVTLSQQQAACLLANAFFCTFPCRNGGQNLPDVNFNRFFERGIDKGAEKLRCILHYFDRVFLKMPTGLLTFRRQFVDIFPDWLASNRFLPRLHVSSKGTIEDDGIGLLQVDFANKFIGGGVLAHGCVQEEIRFLICPELIISCLICQVLRNNEAIIVTGAERYSAYSGYGDTFEWNGDFVDNTSRDKWNRINMNLVAIDAIPFGNFAQQFSQGAILRELNKAYVGFYDNEHPENLSAIATGNWGCGAFRGDKQLKSLLQLMAAAQVERDLAYFTFGDGQFLKQLHNMHTILVGNKVTVGQLLRMIGKFADQLANSNNQSRDLFDFLTNYIHDKMFRLA